MQSKTLSAVIQKTFLWWGFFPLVLAFVVVGFLQTVMIARSEASSLAKRFEAAKHRWAQEILRGDSAQLMQEARALVLTENWQCAVIVDESNRIVAAYPRGDWLGLPVNEVNCNRKYWQFDLSSRGVARVFWIPQLMTNSMRMIAVEGVVLLATIAVFFLLMRQMSSRLEAYASGVREAIRALQGNTVEGFNKEGCDSSPEIEELKWIRESIALQGLRQQELMTARERMAAAEARAELADQVAHDIRSPVGALKAIRGGLHGVDSDVLAVVDSVIERITRIARSLLEDRTARVSPVQSWLSGFLAEKRALLAQMAPCCQLLCDILGDNQAVQNSVIKAVPKIDSGALQQVLSNLINNSAEAIGSGDGTIIIRVSLLGSGKRMLFSIDDSGPGFPSELLIPGALASPVASLKEGGHGLGLVGCARLIRAVGGEMTLANGGRLGGASVAVTLEISQSQIC
ncbi:MAG: hypothetical protein RJB38_2345 [Pseudomonadota bacterium]|jgi:signal transduction histidine kinase